MKDLIINSELNQKDNKIFNKKEDLILNINSNPKKAKFEYEVDYFWQMTAYSFPVVIRYIGTMHKTAIFVLMELLNTGDKSHVIVEPPVDKVFPSLESYILAAFPASALTLQDVKYYLDNQAKMTEEQKAMVYWICLKSKMYMLS